MDYKPKILRFLRSNETPCDVEKVRVAAGIGNWNTCLKHLLELVIEGRIIGQKTSKSWIFWIDKGAAA